MNVIGLDLSITATGLCQPDGKTCTVGGDSKLGDSRLTRIVDAIILQNLARPLHLAVIEDLPTHGKGAGITGMVQGVVRLQLLRLDVPYVLVPAATLKAYATGRGGADKHAMRIAAFKRAGLEFKDDNQCDAWWLRQAALHWYGTPEFDLPAAQRARLDKVAWPQLMEIAL